MDFKFSADKILKVYGDIKNLQGKIFGYMNCIDATTKEDTKINALVNEALKSAEIEGENLEFEQLKNASTAKIGINSSNTSKFKHEKNGMIEMLHNATQHYKKPLTHERLFKWHSLIYPNGFSGQYKIEVGNYRQGEMKFFQGTFGREKKYFEGIPAPNINQEMDIFLAWLNQESDLDNLIKAAIAHFWFISIHAFDDGNGIIARAISDLLLARAVDSSERYYGLSSEILKEDQTYKSLIDTFKLNCDDYTDWIYWFLNCLKNALISTEASLTAIFKKTEFWRLHAKTEINERQRLLLNYLLDNVESKLKSSSWAILANCSPDTALRDIKDLISKNILKQDELGGRSTNYELVCFNDKS